MFNSRFVTSDDWRLFLFFLYLYIHAFYLYNRKLLMCNVITLYVKTLVVLFARADVRLIIINGILLTFKINSVYLLRMSTKTSRSTRLISTRYFHEPWDVTICQMFRGLIIILVHWRNYASYWIFLNICNNTIENDVLSNYLMKFRNEGVCYEINPMTDCN